MLVPPYRRDTFPGDDDDDNDDGDKNNNQFNPIQSNPREVFRFVVLYEKVSANGAARHGNGTVRYSMVQQ